MGTDKLIHFGASFLLTLVLSSHASPIKAGLITLGFGATREAAQSQGAGGWRDMGANAAGVTLGVLAAEKWGGERVRTVYPDGAFVWAPPVREPIIRRLSRCFKADAGKLYAVRYYAVPRTHLGYVPAQGGYKEVVVARYFRRDNAIALVPSVLTDTVTIEHELRHVFAPRNHKAKVFERPCP